MNIAEKVNTTANAKHLANQRFAKRFRVVSEGDQSNGSAKQASKSDCKANSSVNKYNFVGIAG